MKWLRHRKARRDRESGMVFAWRGMRVRFGRTVLALMVVGVAATVLGAVVRVRVLSPPARSERQGSLLVSFDGQAGRWLELRGVEMTPFPAPLEVMDFGPTVEALAAHPALDENRPGDYRPPLRPLPESAGEQRLPVGNAGQRVLPPLPALPAPVDPDDAPGGSPQPVLNPDSTLLAARVPVPLPAFTGEFEAPPAGMRFLIEVAADGRVGAVLPLVAADDAAVAEVERWLRSVRFEPVDEGAGWFALGVAFLSGDD